MEKYEKATNLREFATELAKTYISADRSPFEVDSKYRDNYNKEVDRLYLAMNMSDGEAEKLAKKDYCGELKSYNEQLREGGLYLKNVKKYKAMLEDAQKWEVPSKEYESFRDSVVSKLTSLIEYEPYIGNAPEEMTGREYRIDLGRRAKEGLKFRKNIWIDEVRKCRERLDWHNKLEESLSDDALSAAKQKRDKYDMYTIEVAGVEGTPSGYHRSAEGRSYTIKEMYTDEAASTLPRDQREIEDVLVNMATVLSRRSKKNEKLTLTITRDGE